MSASCSSFSESAEKLLNPLASRFDVNRDIGFYDPLFHRFSPRLVLVLAHHIPPQSRVGLLDSPHDFNQRVFLVRSYQNPGSYLVIRSRLELGFIARSRTPAAASTFFSGHLKPFD